MKKILLSIIILILIFSSVGCKTYNNVMVTTQSVADQTTQQTYLLVFSAYRDVNTVLYYPRIDGLSDTIKQDKLNLLIFEDAKNAITLFDDDIVCITIDYEIVTQTSELISIKYTGRGYVSPQSEKEITVYYNSVVSIPDEKILR